MSDFENIINTITLLIVICGCVYLAVWNIRKGRKVWDEV